MMEYPGSQEERIRSVEYMWGRQLGSSIMRQHEAHTAHHITRLMKHYITEVYSKIDVLRLFNIAIQGRGNNSTHKVFAVQAWEPESGPQAQRWKQGIMACTCYPSDGREQIWVDPGDSLKLQTPGSMRESVSKNKAQVGGGGASL